MSKTSEFKMVMDDEEQNGALEVRAFNQPGTGLQVQFSSDTAFGLTFDSEGLRDFLDELWRGVGAIAPEEVANAEGDER